MQLVVMQREVGHRDLGEGRRPLFSRDGLRVDGELQGGPACHLVPVLLLREGVLQVDHAGRAVGQDDVHVPETAQPQGRTVGTPAAGQCGIEVGFDRADADPGVRQRGEQAGD